MAEKCSQQQKMLLLCPIQEMGANKYKRNKAPGEDHSSEVIIKDQVLVTSLVVQRLGLRASTAGGGFDPGQGNKNPTCQVAQPKKKKKSSNCLLSSSVFELNDLKIS